MAGIVLEVSQYNHNMNNMIICLVNARELIDNPLDS